MTAGPVGIELVGDTIEADRDTGADARGVISGVVRIGAGFPQDD